MQQQLESEEHNDELGGQQAEFGLADPNFRQDRYDQGQKHHQVIQGGGLELVVAIEPDGDDDQHRQHGKEHGQRNVDRPG